jgi:putative hemolysin
MHPVQIATLCAIALATSARTPSEPATKPATEMANPASVNCITQAAS